MTEVIIPKTAELEDSHKGQLQTPDGCSQAINLPLSTEGLKKILGACLWGSFGLTQIPVASFPWEVCNDHLDAFTWRAEASLPLTATSAA